MNIVDNRSIRSTAEIVLPDARIRVGRNLNANAKFQGVFCNPQHLLVMYRGKDCDARVRYQKCQNDDFTPMGSIAFFPARYDFEARGTARDQRIECWVAQERRDALILDKADWSPERLQRTLDIQHSNLRYLLQRLFLEVVHPGFGAQSVVDALLTIILHDLSGTLASDLKAGRSTGSHSKALERVVERIDNLDMVLPTVSELATLAVLSERQLLRVFKNAKGISLSDYIRQSRLEQAQYLLTWSDLPLKEIAYRLGFSSHANFSTAFVRETQSTPTDFRREHNRSLQFSRK